MIRNRPAGLGAAGRAQIAPAELTAAIQATVQRYVGRPGIASVRDIGNGSCFDFAEDVFASLGAEKDYLYRDGSSGLVPMDTDDFWRDDFFADLSLLRDAGEQIPDDLAPDALAAVIGSATHQWIKCQGRYYDATAPGGVDRFLDLPFFADQIQALRGKAYADPPAPTYFVRASIDPEADLARGFSVVANAVVDHEHEIAAAIAETYPDGADHLRPPRLDPGTNMWCWEVEAGLSSFAVPDEASFPEAMEKVHGYASHLGCVAVFASSDFDLGRGADGEDVFRDGRFVGWLDLKSSYADFLRLTDQPPPPTP